MNYKSDTPELSLCYNCWCMTHTLENYTCGKCGEPKKVFNDSNEADIGGYSAPLDKGGE